MDYLKLSIESLPEILFAHRYTTEKYRIRLPGPIDSQVEVTYFAMGNVVKEREDGRKVQLKAPGFHVAFYDIPCTMRSSAKLHSHSTVCCRMRYSLTPLTKHAVAELGRNLFSRPVEPPFAIFPESAPQVQGGGMEEAIQRIIHAHNDPCDAGKMQATSLFFKLLSWMTQESIRTAMIETNILPPQGARYVSQAVEYISVHLYSNITVSQIADALGISTGYLHNLFKTVLGQSVIEYINSLKLERVKELIAVRGATLRQAGESVGIHDENYLSRLFKKHMGITASQFRKLTEGTTEEEIS